MSRILFLLSSMEGGGAERVAALLSNYWAVRGYEVVLMPTFSGRGLSLYTLDKRVRLDYLADRVGAKTNSLSNQIARLRALRIAMREIAPDVIMSFLPRVNIAAILASAGMGIPVVVSERIHPPAIHLGRGLEIMRRVTYLRATSVVVQTRHSLEWLSQTCPRSNGRVIPNPVVHPLPVDNPKIDPGTVVYGSRRVVLAVGRLDHQKGFDLLLRAFAHLAERRLKWDLVILGEGPERERLEAQRQSLDLVGRVHLPGRAGNVGDWYTRADLFVLSSRFEGFPNALLEAMAHGLPVVSYDCKTGPADIVRDAVDGLLVPQCGGVESLSRAIDVLMENEDMRLTMADAAQAVHMRFGLAKIASDWEETLGFSDLAQ